MPKKCVKQKFSKLKTYYRTGDTPVSVHMYSMFAFHSNMVVNVLSRKMGANCLFLR